mmetsp:Transcript_42816/g.134939  ORF Transcript_42816/g.134939 Transcript_42816/m.134939 type:complete len:256 (+) Transcript_42816:638-1405(+)
MACMRGAGQRAGEVLGLTHAGVSLLRGRIVSPEQLDGGDEEDGRQPSVRAPARAGAVDSSWRPAHVRAAGRRRRAVLGRQLGRTAGKQRGIADGVRRGGLVRGDAGGAVRSEDLGRRLLDVRGAGHVGGVLLRAEQGRAAGVSRHDEPVAGSDAGARVHGRDPRHSDRRTVLRVLPAGGHDGEVHRKQREGSAGDGEGRELGDELPEQPDGRAGRDESDEGRSRVRACVRSADERERRVLGEQHVRGAGDRAGSG